MRSMIVAAALLLLAGAPAFAGHKDHGGHNDRNKAGSTADVQAGIDQLRARPADKFPWGQNGKDWQIDKLLDLCGAGCH